MIKFMSSLFLLRRKKQFSWEIESWSHLYWIGTKFHCFIIFAFFMKILLTLFYSFKVLLFPFQGVAPKNYKLCYWSATFASFDFFGLSISLSFFHFQIDLASANVESCIKQLESVFEFDESQIQLVRISAKNKYFVYRTFITYAKKWYYNIFVLGFSQGRDWDKRIIRSYPHRNSSVRNPLLVL